MSTYGYFKHDEMSDYAIAHHGIKGQKWGIRRYQNEDGSLTEAGRRRYGYSYGIGYKRDANVLSAKGLKTKNIDQEAFNNYQIKRKKELNKKELNKQIDVESARNAFNSIDMIGDGSWRNDIKRTKEAARLGIKALKEIGRDIGSGDENDPGTMEWFVFEDQTIGLPTVADLVNQGYSKDQILKLIKGADLLNSKEDEYLLDNVSGVWDLREGFRGNENSGFLDACIKIHNKEKKK